MATSRFSLQFSLSCWKHNLANHFEDFKAYGKAAEILTSRLLSIMTTNILFCLLIVLVTDHYLSAIFFCCYVTEFLSLAIAVMPL